MSKKRESNGGEALLGFLTLGSLAAGIARASGNADLETSHAEILAAARELLDHYDELAKRHRQAAQAYTLLRDENRHLWHQNQHLHALLDQAHGANNTLLQTLADLRSAKARLEAHLRKLCKETT